jgi:hypothetical protein
MKKILSEQILIPILIILITLISLYPLYKRVLATPPDQVFLGTQFYSDDYAVYNSVIRQGIDGRWFFTNKYSTEKTSPSPLRFQYLLLGKIGRVFNLSAPQTYHLSRIFLGLLFLLTTYLLLKEFLIFPKETSQKSNTPRLIAFVLALFAASFPKVVDGNLTPRLTSLPEIDAVIRYFAQPHYQLASIANLIILILFVNFLKKGKLSYLILTAILSLLAMIADPSSVIITVATLLLTIILLNTPLLIEGFRKQKFLILPSTRNAFLFFIVLFSVFAATSLWLQSFQAVEPWKTIFTWDKTSQFPITIKEYLLAIGPTILLAPLGLLTLFSSQIRPISRIRQIDNLVLSKTEGLKISILFSWTISFFVLVFFLSPAIGINRVRFLHAPSFIFIAALSALGLLFLSHILSSFLKRILNSKFLIPNSLIIGLFLLVIVGISLPSFIASLNYQINEWPPSSTLVYPAKDQYDGMLYLKDHTQKDEVVLALYEAASVIPFISGNTVYAGNITETLNYQGKNKQAVEFFQGLYDEQKAKEFLNQNRISYLFVGFQEGVWQTDFINKHPFLSKIYQNPKVTIYKNNNF